MQRLAGFFTRLMQKYMPEPLTIAALFTLVTFALVMLIKGVSFTDSVTMWGSGFWDLLEFTMQMSIILMTGFALASTPLIDRFLNRITSKIRTPSAAIITATLIGCIGNIVHYGFGLIVGALIGRKIAKNVKGVHYPLVIASAYSGFALYGLGLAGTVPITISTPGHFLEDMTGVIPLTETIFSVPMMLTSLVVLITLPILNASLHPKKAEDIIEIKEEPNDSVAVASEAVPKKDLAVADRLNNSKILCFIISVIGLTYIIIYFFQGNTLNLNVINSLMLFIGLFLSGSITRYYQLMVDGVKSIVGLVIQYPFYAGIIVLLSGSGLATNFSNIFISFSTAESLPFWSYISGYFINFLVPSGGGQWALQGPIMIEAQKI